MITVEIPMKTESLANLREHWRKTHQRAKTHRQAAAFHLKHFGARQPPAPPLLIRFTRLAPRPLDSDNNVISFKNLRDGVADYLGVPDNHPGLTFEYAQAKSAEYRVRIELVALEMAT